MLKRLNTLTRVLLQEERALLRATSFTKRAIKEGIPQTIERLKHISNPKDVQIIAFIITGLRIFTSHQKKKSSSWANGLLNL